MSEGQTWPVIIGILAIQPAILGLVVLLGKSYFDGRFDGVNAKMDAKFETVDARFDAVHTRIDHLDRDIQALAKRVMEGPA